MKITDKIISIPPFISTTWDKISSLHMSDKILIITLREGSRIEIPDLPDEIIGEVFVHHGQFLEIIAGKPVAREQSFGEALGSSFRLLFGTLDSLRQALSHNPTYATLAPLPQDVVNKIAELAKTLPPDELASFLHPVDGCNCLYCQIARILKGETHVAALEEEKSEEQVGDDELRFEEWTVESIGDKMYLVTNKLDPQEHYSVYLGDPIGCTCGKANCEHIVAVLRH